jgi:hypothetical protein
LTIHISFGGNNLILDHAYLSDTQLLCKTDSGNRSIIKHNLIIIFSLYKIALMGNRQWASCPGLARGGLPHISCHHNLIKAEDNNQLMFDNGTIARIRFTQ